MRRNHPTSVEVFGCNGNNKQHKKWFCGLMLLLCLPLSACGSGGGEAAVKQAAQLRWDAMISGDLSAAYQYYTDAFRETVPLQRFRQQTTGVGLWNNAQVAAVQCDESGRRCAAEVKITVAMKMRGLPKPIETSDTVHETWVKTGVFSDWRYIKK